MGVNSRVLWLMDRNYSIIVFCRRLGKIQLRIVSSRHILHVHEHESVANININYMYLVLQELLLRIN